MTLAKPPKTFLVTLGLAWMLTLAVASSLRADDDHPYRFEAEDGTLTATQVASSGSGFSGHGYVTGFTKTESNVTWQVTVPEGYYDVVLRYRTPNKKGYDFAINGVTYSGTFDPSHEDFASKHAATVKLTGGVNTFSIEKGWGYFEIDYLELVPTVAPPPPAPVPETLVDDQATPRTHELMHLLVSLYGRKTLSGVYSTKDADSVKQITGQTPAILAGDLIDYSPSRVAHGSEPQSQVEDLIKQHDKGAILSIMWHWNAPDDLIDEKTHVNSDGKTVDASWYFGFYTRATTFDVEKALADPQSKDGQLLLSDIDTIAVQLKKFSDADVPILWRPLHESEGGWFWWGAKGPKPFVQLWHLLYDRLTNVHHLHNMIWVFTGGPDADWYPGDNYVDIIGMDNYPKDRRDPLFSEWEADQKAYGGRKMIALSEFGSVPDLDRMVQTGVRFSYFATWNNSADPKMISKDELTKVYTSPNVLNQPTAPSPDGK